MEVFMRKIKELRMQTGLSQSNFASKYSIPLRTVQSWECEAASSRRSCPPYVYDVLKAQVENDFPAEGSEKKLEDIHDYIMNLSEKDIDVLIEKTTDRDMKTFYLMLIEYLKKMDL
jgi:transcriptional regulator with XRE-family HTH domain